jgi:hypothetical protein
VSILSIRLFYLIGVCSCVFILALHVNNLTLGFRNELRITSQTFVNIVGGFHKALLCECAIKIPAISQSPTPTGSNPKKNLISTKSHWIV